MRDTAKSITDLYQRLRPHILRDIQPGSGGAGSGGAGMVAHSLSGAYHTGTLLQSQAPWAATKADLAALTDTGMIHDRVHELASTSGLGADHTVSGLTAGQYLRASGPTSAAFAAIQDADIPSTIVRTSRQVLAGNGLSGGGDLSANRTISVGAGTLISVSTTQVSVASGSAYQYIGTGSGSTPSWRELSELAGNGLSLSGAALTVNVSGLGLSVATDAVTLTSSSSPGAAASILASDATGKLTLPLFVATTSVTTPTLASGAATELAITSGADTYLNPGSNIVKLGTDKLIRSYSFTSGFAGSGWQIDQSSGATNAEFDNLTVRGTMRVYELLIQQIRATNGSIFVTAAAKLASASLISGSSYDCYVEGDSGDYAPFAVGDVLRAQRVNLGTSTVVYRSDLTVTAIGVGGNPLRFTATLRAGTTAPAAGMEFVRLGSTSDAARRGSIYLTADDSGAPFIDVVNGVTAHTDWNTVGMVKVRIGRLDGITGNSNEYGIWAGTGTGDTAQSIVASSASVSLNNVPLRFKAGSSTVVMELAPGSSAPYMALGSTLPTGPLVGNGLWMGKDGSDYEFRVGTVSGGALVKGIHWDGSNLTWKATNTTLDASGNLTATNAVLSGQVTATSGAIGGWSLSASGLTATNIGLYSGAANTARVQVGSGSDVAGINATAAAGDIAFWAGDTHANRASADFRVTAAGALYATTGTIAGDFTVTSPGRLIASGGGIVLTATGINVALWSGIDGGQAPSDESKSLAWYDTPGTASGLQVRQYVGKDTSSQPHWNVVVAPNAAAPLKLSLWYGGASQNGLWFTNLAKVVGMPGLLLAAGSPNTVQVLSGARLQLNSGSTFVATTHLEAGVASTYDLGTSGVPWRKLYADEVVAGTITGSVSLGGQTWQYDTADMYIRSSSASARTLYISNPSTGSMSLDVEGSITVGGTVDGVDLAAFKSAYDVHTHDTRYYTETELQTSGSASVHWNNLTNKPSTYAPSAHALVGADHTASGLTAGHVVKATGATTFAWAQLAHSDLSGIGTNTHSQIDTHIATSDTHVAHSGVSITAGAGLTGGGTIAASRTLAVGAGYGITVNADDVALASTVAGAGLTYTTGVLAVGAGDGISVSADTVSLASSVAGNGLTYTTGVLAVGVSGLGLSVAADAVTLTSSSNPGAAASILATDASGHLQLVKLGIGTGTSSYAAVNISGSTFDDGAIRFQNTGSSNTHNFRAGMRSLSSSTGFFGISYDDASYPSDFLAVRETGYVGIGTYQPESKLHVAAGSVRVDHLYAYTIENSAGNLVTVATVDAGNILVMGGNNINGFQIGDNDAYIKSTGAAGSRYMQFYSGDADENMRLDQTGKLWLYNASGGLDVSGSANFSDDLSVDYGDLIVGSTNMFAVENYGSYVLVGINADTDPQFDVNVGGTLRATYLVGKLALEVTGAIGIHHFDGPQPYSADFTGTLATHRGEEPATATDPIFREGRFEKALQIARSTTNWIKNPSFETLRTTNLDGSAAHWTTYQGETVDFSDEAVFGYQSVQITTGASSNPYMYNTGSTLSLATGQTWCFSAYVKAANAQSVGKSLRLFLRENASSSYQSYTTVTLTDQWQRVKVRRTLTHATPTQLNHYTSFISTGGSGDSYYLDAMQLENASTWTPYHDGSMSTPSSWTGTAHESTSTRSTSITYSNYIPRSAFTIWGWFKPNLAEDDVTSVTTSFKNYFFQVGTYSGNPSLTLGCYYNYASVRLYTKNTTDASWTISNAYQFDLDWAADEWIFLAITWDGQYLRTYGKRADDNSDTAWKTYTSSDVTGHFGEGDNLDFKLVGTYGDDLVDDVVVLDRAASESELKQVAFTNAPVYAATSTMAFRAPTPTPIKVNNKGFWAEDINGRGIFGIYAGTPGNPANTHDWAGYEDLGMGDTVIGNITNEGSGVWSGGGVWWDASEQVLDIGVPATNHIAFTGDAITFKNSTTTLATLSGTSWTIGNSALNHVTITATGLTIGYNTTDAITLDSSGNASFTGAITATSGTISGTLTIGASGKITATNTEINSGGIIISAPSTWGNDDGYKFASSGVVHSGLWGHKDASDNKIRLYSNASPSYTAGYFSGVSAQLEIGAWSKSAGTSSTIQLNATHDSYGSAYLTLLTNSSGRQLFGTNIDTCYINGALATMQINGNNVWHAGNDGHGSTLDADKLDSIEETSFGRLDVARTWSALQTFDASLRVGADPGSGAASKLTLTNATSGISTGAGTVKMAGATYRDSAGWIKMYSGTTAIYIPYWTTITG